MKITLRIVSIIVAWTLSIAQLMPSAFALNQGLIATTPADPTGGALGMDTLLDAVGGATVFPTIDFSTPGTRVISLKELAGNNGTNYALVIKYAAALLAFAQQHGVSFDEARRQMPGKLAIHVDDVASDAEAKAKLARVSTEIQPILTQTLGSKQPLPPLDQMVSVVWGTNEQMEAQLRSTETGSGQAPGTGVDAAIGSGHGGLMRRAEHDREFNEQIAPILQLIGQELQLPPLGGSRHPVYDFFEAVRKTNPQLLRTTQHGYITRQPSGVWKIIDSRFPVGHAGRNAMTIYAPDEPTAAHEETELLAVMDCAIALGLVTEQDVLSGHRLGDAIQAWLAKQAKKFPRHGQRIADAFKYFHLLGLEAEWGVRGHPLTRESEKFSPSRHVRNLPWKAILLDQTNTKYRSWLRNLVEPTLQRGQLLWEGVPRSPHRDEVRDWLRAWKDDLARPQAERELDFRWPTSPIDHAIASSAASTPDERHDRLAADVAEWERFEQELERQVGAVVEIDRTERTDSDSVSFTVETVPGPMGTWRAVTLHVGGMMPVTTAIPRLLTLMEQDARFTERDLKPIISGLSQVLEKIRASGQPPTPRAETNLEQAPLPHARRVSHTRRTSRAARQKTGIDVSALAPIEDPEPSPLDETPPLAETGPGKGAHPADEFDGGTGPTWTGRENGGRGELTHPAPQVGDKNARFRGGNRVVWGDKHRLGWQASQDGTTNTIIYHDPATDYTNTAHWDPTDGVYDPQGGVNTFSVVNDGTQAPVKTLPPITWIGSPPKEVGTLPEDWLQIPITAPSEQPMAPQIAAMLASIGKAIRKL